MHAFTQTLHTPPKLCSCSQKQNTPEKKNCFRTIVLFISKRVPFLSLFCFHCDAGPARLLCVRKQILSPTLPTALLQSDANPTPNPAHCPAAMQARHAYYASVSWLDWNVGRIIDELAVLGMEHNTVHQSHIDLGCALCALHGFKHIGLVSLDGPAVPGNLHISHTSITYQSHINHTSITHQSHISHTSVTLQSHINHTSITHHTPKAGLGFSTT